MHLSLPDPSALPPSTLGAVLAGGRGTRFGGRNKLLATLDGVPLVARAAAALSAAVDRVVVITADPEVAAAVDLPWRHDRITGAGPLAGLDTALEWAQEMELGGVLAVGGDMPLLTHEVLRRLLERAESPATVPASPDGIRLQPLCAWYSVEILPEVRRRLAARDLKLHRFLGEIGAHFTSEATLAGGLDPALVFMSVNTRADLKAAAAAAVTLSRETDA